MYIGTLSPFPVPQPYKDNTTQTLHRKCVLSNDNVAHCLDNVIRLGLIP